MAQTLVVDTNILVAVCPNCNKVMEWHPDLSEILFISLKLIFVRMSQRSVVIENNPVPVLDSLVQYYLNCKNYHMDHTHEADSLNMVNDF